jgi:putative SOS response-associated peptidase YedK
VAPTDPLPVVRYDAKVHQCHLDVMTGVWCHSGPRTSRTASSTSTKAEEIETQSAFREAFQRRRRLVPVDNFYEWQKTPTAKQPTS